MTIRFAHMADLHLGAFRDERLRELNLRAFEEAMDTCLEEDLDFVIISGDLFHVSLPEMSVVDRGVRKLRQLRETGTRLYLVYGSHDFSAGGSSLIDVLESAALFTKATVASTEEGDQDEKTGERLYLDFVEDDTGALICGMPGRKSTLERKYYDMLETGALEKREGFKIFAFHSAITEFRPDYLPEEDSIPLSMFPKGFDYYAGGHVHERFEKFEEGYGHVVYPGTLLGYDYTDLERGSRIERGFYIVEHDPGSGRTETDFRQVRVAEIGVVDVDCDGLEPAEANTKMRKEAGRVETAESIVLLRVHGRLSSGKASEITINEVREGLDQSGAAAVFINRNQLKGAEIERMKVETGEKEEIEDRLFLEYVEAHGSRDPRFQGDRGKELCRDLFEIVRTPTPEGRTKKDHRQILLKKAMPLFEGGDD